MKPSASQSQGTSVADRLADMHPQMLRAASEMDRKKLADLGRSLDRALEIWGKTKQQTAFLLGYRDPGTISRWCAGTERMHLEKLLALDGFEEAWMEARAQQRPERFRVRKTIEFEQKVGA